MKIHESAVISPKAELAQGVEVGPYSVIGDNVKIGAGTKIGAHCVIDGYTTIGSNNKIFTGAVVGSIPQDLKYKGEKTFLVIGDNNVIREYATLNPGTKEGTSTTIGNNNELMAYSHIAHDCVLGNNIIIANNGTLAGHVVVEDKAVIGGLVAIHQFVRIGTLSIIGGCSKVVQDILPYSMTDGHPAKLYGINALGLRRAGVPLKTRNDLKKAMRIISDGEVSIPHAAELINKQINPKSEQINYLLEFIKKSERGIAR